MNDATRKAASRLASARAIRMPTGHAPDHPSPAVMESAKETYRRATRKGAPKRLDPLTDAAVAATVLLDVYLADHDVPIIQQARDHIMAGLDAVSRP